MAKIKDIPKVDIDKIKKILKNTGNAVYIVGWLMIISDIGIYLWSVLDKSFAEYQLLPPLLSAIFFSIIIASIFIILGNRVRGLVDKNIKVYLQIILGLGVFYLLLTILTASLIGSTIFFFIIIYSIYSLVAVRKAMKVEEFTATLTSPQYKLDKKGWIIFAVGAVVLFFVAVSIDLSMQTQENNETFLQEIATQMQNNENYSKAEFIAAIVRKIKAETPLPHQMDEVTLLNDVTAEPNAIRYHHVISDVDTSQLSNSYLKSSLVSIICANTDTQSVLNEEINMEYSFTVKDSAQKYFVSFTKNDCSQ